MSPSIAINLKFPMQNATRRRHTGEIGGTQELFARDGRSARRHRIEGRMYRGVYTDYVSQSWETTGAGIGARRPGITVLPCGRDMWGPYALSSFLPLYPYLSLSLSTRLSTCLPACLSVCRACSLPCRWQSLSTISRKLRESGYVCLDWRLEALNIKTMRIIFARG